MTKKERYKKVIEYFQENQRVAETELHYKDPYQLLTAVILSAQCTDKRVNLITPALFKAFPTVFDMAKASVEQIFEYIKSCSYPNNKAKHLLGMAGKLVSDYNGEVPSDVELLQTLPGVGRKTANVIASIVFEQPRIAVDTHVFRVAFRLGLSTHAKNPLQTELQLTRNIPEELRPIAHHWLILHGRYICKARKPECLKCGMTKFCKYFNSNRQSTC